MREYWKWVGTSFFISEILFIKFPIQFSSLMLGKTMIGNVSIHASFYHGFINVIISLDIKTMEATIWTMLLSPIPKKNNL